MKGSKMPPMQKSGPIKSGPMKKAPMKKKGMVSRTND